MQINERADRLECESTLFEENCEQTWEKGGSGLVFHTDDAYWDEMKGDFHERTADALDVLPGDEDAACDWEAGTVDPDADEHLDMLNAKMITLPAHGHHLIAPRGADRLCIQAPLALLFVLSYCFC